MLFGGIVAPRPIGPSFGQAQGGLDIVGVFGQPLRQGQEVLRQRNARRVNRLGTIGHFFFPPRGFLERVSPVARRLPV